MKNKKGFTLIELLVVIAIIGILSSIVLASLNSARMKGDDAAIKSILGSARSQAEIYYDTHSQVYTDICSDEVDGIAAMKTSAEQRSVLVECNQSDTEWAMQAQLKTVSDPQKYWCVDSMGASREQTTVLGPATSCI